MRIKAQENEKRQDHSCLFPYSISGRSSPMKNTATVPCPAGLPMMEVLKHQGVVNCCCEVTRYIGGVLLGAAAVGSFGQERFRPGICAAILLCYTVGAAVAVLLTVRVNVMDILRDKE